MGCDTVSARENQTFIWKFVSNISFNSNVWVVQLYIDLNPWALCLWPSHIQMTAFYNERYRQWEPAHQLPWNNQNNTDWVLLKVKHVKQIQSGIGFPTMSYTPLSTLMPSSPCPSAALPLFKLFLDSWVTLAIHTMNIIGATVVPPRHTTRMVATFCHLKYGTDIIDLGSPSHVTICSSHNIYLGGSYVAFCHATM